MKLKKLGDKLELLRAITNFYGFTLEDIINKSKIKNKKNKIEDNIKYVGYEQALTDYEILLYVQIINQFENEEIDFPSLKKIFLNYGVNIEPITKDISNKKMTVDEESNIKKA